MRSSNPNQAIPALAGVIVALLLAVVILGWMALRRGPAVPYSPSQATAPTPVAAPIVRPQISAPVPIPLRQPIRVPASTAPPGRPQVAPSDDLPPAHQPTVPNGGVSVQAFPAATFPGVQNPPAPPRSQPTATAAVSSPADFDRYIRWLRYVEQERAGMRALSNSESFQAVDSRGVRQRLDGQSMDFLRRRNTAMRLFRQNVARTKPPVPADMRALDAYYMRALETEGQQSVVVLEQANTELAKAYQARQMPQAFRLTD